MKDDDAVWHFVANWVKGHVKLVLRPTAIPAGFTSATVEAPILDGNGKVIKADHDMYSALYSGPAGEVWFEAGYENPPPAKPGTDQVVEVRGNTAHLYQTSGGDTWLYWHEEGQSPPRFLYSVRAAGVDKDVVLRIARSLQPYP